MQALALAFIKQTPTRREKCPPKRRNRDPAVPYSETPRTSPETPQRGGPIAPSRVHPYLQGVDGEGGDGGEVHDLQVVDVAVHDDGGQVDAAGRGGHADLAELVVEELPDYGTLAHALGSQHGDLERCHHAAARRPLPWCCPCGAEAAYSRAGGLSPIQDAFPLWDSPSLQGQGEVGQILEIPWQTPLLLQVRFFSKQELMEKGYICPWGAGASPRAGQRPQRGPRHCETSGSSLGGSHPAEPRRARI